jgi:hypothetical protein
MDFWTQKERAIAVMTHGRLPRRWIHPPLLLLLWKLRVKIRPPLFMGFAANTAVWGAFFGLCWGTMMWFTAWSRDDMSPLLAAAGSTLAGLCFGLMNAFYVRRMHEKYGLPTWESLLDLENLDDAATPALHR